MSDNVRHTIRYIPGMGHQVVKSKPGKREEVVGTYDDRKEAEERHRAEVRKMQKEAYQEHWDAVKKESLNDTQ